jgi:hypothetical protein
VEVKMKIMAMTVVAVLVSGKLSVADVVPPAPTSCPEGSVGSTCHGGPHCAALNCQTDADCLGGAVCREIAACTGSTICGGRIAPGQDAIVYGRDTIEAACPASATCPSGAPCQQIRVCVPPKGGSGGSTGATGTGGTAGATSAGSIIVVGGSAATTGTAAAGSPADASGPRRLGNRGCGSIGTQGFGASAVFLAALGLLAVLSSPAKRRAARRLWRTRG